MKEKFRQFLKWIQHYSDRSFYPELVGSLAAIDYWVLFIPTDPLVISGVMFSPKRWLRYALIIPVFSTIGAMTFTMFVGEQGLPYLQSHWPGIDQTSYWLWIDSFFANYGLLVVFLVAATPMSQHPPLMVAALAQTPYMHIALACFAGRLLKYIFLCWIASHAPGVISRLWGFKG